MTRPRILTDEERRASNAKRQKRWRERWKGFAKLKERNRVRKGRKGVEAAVEIAKPVREVREVQETYYGPEPGVDIGYEEAQVKTEGRVVEGEVEVEVEM